VQGIVAIVVILVSHFVLAATALFFVSFLHVAAFAISIAAFIYSLLNFPYTSCLGDNEYKGCEMDKAAIGLDCVLWYSPPLNYKSL